MKKQPDSYKKYLQDTYGTGLYDDIIKSGDRFIDLLELANAEEEKQKAKPVEMDVAYLFRAHKRREETSR